MRFVVSTIGTSILTNSIKRATEGDWFTILGESANLKEDKLSDESRCVIDTLAERARDKLNTNDVGLHRRASAELNGIYGIYEGTLPQNTQDQHHLICTDTFQGRTTGDLIKEFLENQGFNAEIVIPEGLSTKDTDSFTDGTKELIKWLEDNVPWRRDSGYQVIFNLVGGFKSLQGYMQTFGTFYADETVYIFEKSSDLIKIPRLPIQIDTTVIEQYRRQFAMMEAEALCPITEVTGVRNIPETLWDTIEVDGVDCVALSAWGLLIWNQTKAGFLETDTHAIQNLDDSEKVKLALMDNDKQYPRTRVTAIQEVFLEFVMKNSVAYAKMSVWGKLAWEQAKEDLFKVDLLPFPRLQYQDSFRGDFERHHPHGSSERYRLQETLARVAYILDRDNGSTAGLAADHGLQYSSYRGHPGIDHFRVNGGRRVSCRADGGNLILRHCGPHDYVNRNP